MSWGSPGLDGLPHSRGRSWAEVPSVGTMGGGRGAGSESLLSPGMSPAKDSTSHMQPC